MNMRERERNINLRKRKSVVEGKHEKKNPF